MKYENLYLNWQDETTFVGIGEVLEIGENKPIVGIGDSWFQPVRCKVMVVDSEYYTPGTVKHFIIPKLISDTQAIKIQIKEEKRREKDRQRFNIGDDIIERGNPIVDSMQDIQLREYYLAMRKKYTFANEPLPDNVIEKIFNMKSDADKLRTIKREMR